MENYCSNFVQFTSDPYTVSQIQWLFRAISSLENTHHHQPSPNSMGQHTEDIKNVDFLEGKIYFETSEKPNTELLQLIADYYGCSFKLDYHDLGRALFGQANYEDGQLKDTRIELQDIEGLNYDLDINAYHFQGEYYRSDAEVLEILLTAKLAHENIHSRLRR